MKNGQSEGLIIVELPQVPLSNEKEVIVVALESPTSGVAKIGSVGSTNVTVNHNNGKTFTYTFSKYLFQ